MSPSAGIHRTESTVGSIIETDALIIGAGPAGLFQVFELGLLEVKAHVIDSLPEPGGQCIALYPDKPIYDIPALPVCTGKELVNNLLKQIEPFGATFHLGQEVSVVRRLEDGRFHVETNKGAAFVSKTVFIAGGVGAFQPRPLKVEGLDQFHNRQLFYHAPNPALFAGKKLVIVGGGDTAIDWALSCAEPGPDQAESVTLIHRRDSFNAAPAAVLAMKARCEAQDMQFIAGQITGFEHANGQLTQVKVTDSAGLTQRLPLDMLLVLLGLSPKLGPITEWGLNLDRKQVVVDTEKFETSIPGIFAVGDINTYPGKRKLILCGFHEGTLAAFGAAPYIFPERPVQLQYTTSSSKLHRLLGVDSHWPDQGE